ncbi:hypothetical protein JCM5296_004839 [Sporobolomyces johnsonii]
MSFFQEATEDEVQVEFLPARAAAISLALSSVASFIALVYLVQASLLLDLDGGHVVLLAFTALSFTVFVSTGLVVAYARFLPPPQTRIWEVVSATVSYLAILWIVSSGLSTALCVDVLYPSMTCALDDLACTRSTRSAALSSFVTIIVALILSLVLALLVSFDLRHRRAAAQIIITHAEMQQLAPLLRPFSVLPEGYAARPLLRPSANPNDYLSKSYRVVETAKQARALPSSRPQLDATFLTRARAPFDDPLTSYTPPTPSNSRNVYSTQTIPRVDIPGVPLMLSEGKRRNRRDEETTTDESSDDTDQPTDRRREPEKRKKEEEEEPSRQDDEDDDDETTERSHTKRHRRRHHSSAHNHSSSPEHQHGHRHDGRRASSRHRHHHHHDPRTRKEQKIADRANTTNIEAMNLNAGVVATGM